MGVWNGWCFRIGVWFQSVNGFLNGVFNLFRKRLWLENFRAIKWYFTKTIMFSLIQQKWWAAPKLHTRCSSHGCDWWYWAPLILTMKVRIMILWSHLLGSSIACAKSMFPKIPGGSQVMVQVIRRFWMGKPQKQGWKWVPQYCESCLTTATIRGDHAFKMTPGFLCLVFWRHTLCLWHVLDFQP